MLTRQQYLSPPLAKMMCYCASCQSMSTFVWMDALSDWACIGNYSTRQEGCGERLRKVDQVRFGLKIYPEKRRLAEA